MPKKSFKSEAPTTDDCCSSDCCGSSCACHGLTMWDCCKVEAVVSVDGRGQMVLPKDVRTKAGIGPDDKLAVVSWSKGGSVCCITLQRADDIAEVVRKTYGPLLSSAGLRP